MQARSIPPLPDQPTKKRKSTKLVWVLIFLFIIVLSVLFFRSPISKITSVTIIDNTFTDPVELKTTSGLLEGEPFFLVSEKQVTLRLLDKFPYMKSISLKKQFPGRIEVSIQEYDAVAYELNKDGVVLACLENGTEVRLSKSKKLVLEKPILTNWTEPAAVAMKQELGKKLGNIPDSLLLDISEIRYDPSNSYANRIKLYTRSGFEVVTTVTMLPDKIAYLSGVVETQEPGRITMLEADSYISYTNLAKSDEDASHEDSPTEDE